MARRGGVARMREASRGGGVAAGPCAWRMEAVRRCPEVAAGQTMAGKTGSGGAELRWNWRLKKGLVDLVVNTEKFRGSTIKQNFPLV